VPDPVLVLTHELAHAATLVGYRTNERVRRQVDQMAKDLQAQAAGKATPADWARYSRYLANGEEFIAGMLSDNGFADWADVQRIGGATPYARFKQFVGNFLGLKGEANETLGMVVDFANRLILDPDTQDSLRAALQASGRGSPAALAGSTTSPRTCSPPTRRRCSRCGTWPRRRCSACGRSLYLTSLQQIVERNMDLFTNGDMPNLLQRHFDLTNQREAMANKLRQGYEHIVTRWRDFRSLNTGPAGDLARLMIDTTLSAIHPDRPSGPRDQRLGRRAAGRRREARRLLGAVGGPARRGQAHLRRRARRLRARLGEQPALDPDRARRGVRDRRGDDGRRRTYDDIDRLDTDVQTKADLKAAMDLGKVHGPYFPLRRTGKYFTIATSDWKTRIVSDAELNELGSTPETQISSYSRVKDGGWKVRYRNRVVESHNTMGEAKRSAADYKRQGAPVRLEGGPLRPGPRRGRRPHRRHRGRRRQLAGVQAGGREPGGGGTGATVLLRAGAGHVRAEAEVEAPRHRRRRRRHAAQLRVYARANSYHQAQVTYGRHLQETVNGMRGFAKQLAQMGQPERSAKATAVYNHLVERDRVLRTIGTPLGRDDGAGQGVGGVAAARGLLGADRVRVRDHQRHPADHLHVPHPGRAARLRPLAQDDGRGLRADRPGGRRRDDGRVRPHGPRRQPAQAGQPQLARVQLLRARHPAPPRGRAGDGAAHGGPQPDRLRAGGGRAGHGEGERRQPAARPDAGHRPGERAAVKDVFGFVSDFAFIAPQAVETMNRVVTAVSAHRLAKEDGVRDPAELERYVARSLDKTQWLYSQSNKPLAF
jgi:hypothetical protein